MSFDATISRKSANASFAPNASRAASAVSRRVVQTAVSSTSGLACSAGKCDCAAQVERTLAPMNPRRIRCAMNVLLTSGSVTLHPWANGRSTESSRSTNLPCTGHGTKTFEEASMSALSRRHFVVSLAAASSTLLVPHGLRAAMGPNDKFDLLVKGGDVLDPSQNLRAKRDVGLRFGLVEAVE